MIYDVIVYGPLFCDLIFTGMETMPELGKEIYAGGFTMALGGSAIVAAGLQKLGAKVGLAVDLGNDILSRATAGMLDDMGIDRSLVREHPRPLTHLTVALSFPKDRAFITRFEQPDTPIDLAALLRQHPAKHVHIGSFLGVVDAPGACRIAHDAGATISMDPGWDEVALRDPRLHDMVKDLDFFLPSRMELCYMVDGADCDRALDKLLARMSSGGTIIMKDGKDGAIARGPGADERVPSLSVTPIDTTGAGDAFDAGFLYAYTQGYPLRECLRYGVVCGALTTTVIGGATGTPNLEDVQKWLSKLQS